MARVNTDLTRLQWGLEAAASPGTLVAATHLVPVTEASFQRMQDRENLDELRGIMADYDDILTRTVLAARVTQALDFENLIPTLMCGLENATAVGADPSVWTFTPGTAGPVDLRTATINVGTTDGGIVTNINRFGNARPTSIQIAIGDSGYATLVTTWMGRLSEVLSALPAVTALDRTPIPVDLFEVYIDDTWGGLGTTSYGELRSANIEINPGLAQAFTKSGRAGLDPAGWYRSRVQGVCALTVNQDAMPLSELGHLPRRRSALRPARGRGSGRRRPAPIAVRHGGALHRDARRTVAVRAPAHPRVPGAHPRRRDSGAQPARSQGDQRICLLVIRTASTSRIRPHPPTACGEKP